MDVCEVFLCMFSVLVNVVWPLPGEESDHYWLASVRPEPLQYPVNTHNTSPDPSLLSWELSPLPPPVSSTQLSPSPLLPPSLDTASQGESEHTPSQMCVRCLNPNIEKHSTFIIWVSEKFRTFNSMLQPPTLAEKKSSRCKPKLKLRVWILKINIVYLNVWSLRNNFLITVS